MSEPQKLYLIQSGDIGPIKVGVAKDPEHRLRDLQVAHYAELRLLHVCEHARARWLECRVHAILAERRMRGEWFAVTLSEAIAAIVEAINETPILTASTRHVRGTLAPSEQVGHRRIMAIWPTHAAFAAAMGVPESTAQQWWFRNKIASSAFRQVLVAARDVSVPDDIEISYDALFDLRPAQARNSAAQEVEACQRAELEPCA